MPRFPRVPAGPLAVSLVVLGAVARLLPHPPNFTPVGGIAVFGGARMRGWSAYLLPLLMMLLTDPILAARHGFPAFSRLTPVIYGSLLLNVLLGRLLQGRAGVLPVIGVTTLGSIQFFLLTNFAVWAFGSFYIHTTAGLLTCYTAALPFFGRTLAGDLFYAGALLAIYQYLSAKTTAEPVLA